MPLNVQSVLYAQVWTLLEGFIPFTALVLPGNRYKTTRPREAERAGIQSNPVNFPRVYIATPDKTTGRGIPMPFNDDPDFVDMGVPMTLSLDWEIVCDGTDIASQTPAEAAFEAGLMRRGRTLDLRWVTSYVNQSTSRKIEMIGGTNRISAKGRLTVQARPLRSLLIAV